MSTDSTIRVAVIGGGIGGLSLALGLLKHPHLDVQIYEASPVFSEIGAGLTVGPNAREAMQIISPTLFDAFNTTRTPNLWPDRRNNYMLHRVGYGENAGQIISSPQSRGGAQCVHRARFLDKIAKDIPPERAHFNKRLVAIEEKNKIEPVILYFADGTTETADAVVGADGIRSFVRTYVVGKDHPAAKPVFAESVSYRHIVPMELAIEKLGAEHAENATMLCGPGATMLTYPLDSGKSMNVICSDNARKSWEHEEWTHPCSREELDQIYAGWSPQAQALIELLLTNPDLMSWAAYDTLPAPSYYAGRVVLMGDSAHASTPYQGQGSAHAMEDALVLEAVLGQTKSVAHIVKAFAAYDQIRRPRSQRMVATSRECGLLLSMQLKGIGTDIKKMNEELESRFGWLWNRDQLSQSRAVVELFNESIRPTVEPSWQQDIGLPKHIPPPTENGISSPAL